MGRWDEEGGGGVRLGMKEEMRLGFSVFTPSFIKLAHMGFFEKIVACGLNFFYPIFTN